MKLEPFRTSHDTQTAQFPVSINLSTELCTASFPQGISMVGPEVPNDGVALGPFDLANCKSVDGSPGVKLVKRARLTEIKSHSKLQT